MASQNQLSRYGAFSRVVPDEVLAPGSKLFLVADSDDTSIGIAPLELLNDYPVDQDGIVRVYTTIQAAVNACAGGRGDVVLVLPNHVELLNRADSWNVAGVQIIGMGHGDQRAGVRFDTVTSEIGLGANGVRVSNLNFLASQDSVTRGIDMDSGFFGQRIDHCLFNIDSGTDNFVAMIRAGAKESVIEDNQFITGDTVGTVVGISLLGGDPDHLLIRNNYFYGQFDSGVIAVDTSDTNDTNLSGVVVDKNVIVSTDTATVAGSIIRFTVGGYTQRGILTNNRIATYDCAAADTAQVEIGGLLFGDNRISRSDTTEKLIGQTAVKITDSGN